MSEPLLVELWGFLEPDIEVVRASVERALEIELTLHESASIGPYYFAPLCASHAELTLRPNRDPSYDLDVDDPDEAFEEPDFPDFPVLLYVEWYATDHSCRQAADALGGEAQLLLVE